MGNELDTLVKVCERLEKDDIKYMITGSFAASFYATPRMTRDIDIVIEIKSQDVEKMMGSFSKDFYISREMIEKAIDHQSMFNIIDLESMTKIDCIIKKNNEYREEEFERRKRVNLHGKKANLVSPEDLIISKLDWAKDSQSEIQLSDVKNLLMDVKGLDIDYLEKWINRLGLEEIYSKVKES